VVSAGAEADFDLGMNINVHGTLNILEACRAFAPRLVFASSVAVYGGDMPAVIEDATALTPQSSYPSFASRCRVQRLTARSRPRHGCGCCHHVGRLRP
jgi:nucleoside-diphosphate-sugar epimerase